VVTLFLPAIAAQVSIAIFLLLLGPVIAEAAARERLAGTAATVFAQPGVPRSAVQWKVAVVTAFVTVVGAPVLVRSVVRGPAYGLAMLLALLFVATAAAGLGWLSPVAASSSSASSPPSGTSPSRGIRRSTSAAPSRAAPTLPSARDSQRQGWRQRSPRRFTSVHAPPAGARSVESGTASSSCCGLR